MDLLIDGACDDLGGESSGPILLLSQPPEILRLHSSSHVTPIQRQDMEQKVALLFSLLLDELAKKAPQLVLVHVVDKITRL
uniref:Uncharacterized protein n=1 Tax=Ditylenchus dipsaci TaxID=166011 RepID=A0A915DGT9_9BILA